MAFDPGPVGLTGSIAVIDDIGSGTHGRVLCLSGEVDLAVVLAFERQHGAAPVPVDAAAVTFIGSAGLVFLLRWVDAARAAGRPATLRSTSAPVDMVLRITGLTGVLAGEDARESVDTAPQSSSTAEH
ncbi:anti-anti-sigma factor [Geodermatophilus amargosae]|uniref:Anti-anti-sigma factor n=1 Tax=Geodermatophilus amargosae TaxID=1296565 RepID=A0A1I7D8E6_9ACTN|nr:STAS domain-containing protein [Geodermatophilus amargosae]SFU08023.1 anti-anti-sigma factor [Geodermatophilus amargosae]